MEKERRRLLVWSHRKGDGDESNDVGFFFQAGGGLTGSVRFRWLRGVYKRPLTYGPIRESPISLSESVARFAPMTGIAAWLFSITH